MDGWMDGLRIDGWLVDGGMEDGWREGGCWVDEWMD